MKPVAVRVHKTEAAGDVVLSITDDVTVAEVFEVLQMPAHASIDGQVPETPCSTPARSLLRAGSQISVTPVGGAGSLAHGFVDANVVAGLNAGGTCRLGAGLFHLSMTVDDGHTAWVVQIDDSGPERADAAAWHDHGTSVEIVGACVGPTLALSSPIDSEPAALAKGPTVSVQRPPRPGVAATSRPIEFETIPDQVREPAPLSWATLLAPVPIAVLMAVYFRPIFALFAAMGPIMALGRWWESRRRYNRSTVQRAQAIGDARRRVREQIEVLAETEARRQWASNPHVAALWQQAITGSVRLWQRRRTHDDFLVAAIAVGHMAIPITTVDATPPAELADLVKDPMVVRAVPHSVNFAAELAVGVCGQRQHARAVVYSLLAQLATTHGPADLRIGVLCAPEHADRWDWLKWLPHLDHGLVGTSASDLVANMPPAPQTTLRLVDSDAKGPATIIVLDAPGADGAALIRAAAKAEIDLRCIAIATHATGLPAICSMVAHVNETTLRLDEGRAGQHPLGVAPIGLSEQTADAWARSLSRFRDPEETGSRDHVGEGSGFLELIGHPDNQDGSAKWAARSATAATPIVLGEGPHGPFSLDLTNDGPHALIGGTTGSGKSELLRTLVVALATQCSPEDLNFVLVDFKGGGAFDVVSALPHVVGMITDLDEAFVARALVSIRAELEHRERLFRELGVSTFEDAKSRSVTALARLVIVIDEFAVLATDYGELLDGIVDLAARGRSLGMHLVLATQRPSGVVDQKIRANTNIRIALRVQDEFDSQDLIGSADAAHIDRRLPGHAFVRIGGDRPVPVHVAFGGRPFMPVQTCQVRSHRLFAAEHIDYGAATTNTRTEAVPGPTELEALVESLARAATCQEQTARPLWAPLLPERLDWIDLGTRDLVEPAPPAGYALGLVDLPELQMQSPWRWDPSTGALALYGASGESAAKALVSLGAAMASAASPQAVQIYVVDGDAGGISALDDLPHVGSCIRAHDTERVERLIRRFETALESRRQSPSTAHPALVLVIDNLASMLAAHHDAHASLLNDRISALARDGSVVGLHLVITARTPRDITHRLAQQIPNRLVMDLADSNGFLCLGMRMRDVVPLPPMRAIEPRTGHVLQLVEPPDIASLVASTKSADPVVPAIGRVPTVVDANDLPGATVDAAGELTIPVGIESVDLGVATLALRPGEHVLIVAAPGMGGSTFLDLLARQVGHADVHATVVTVDSSTEPAAVHALVDTADTTVVIVDDAESLPPGLQEPLTALLEAKNPHVRVVAKVRPESARSVRSWIAHVRASATGLLIGGSAADGDLFRVRLGPLVGRGTLPGRATLVDRGRVVDVQLARPNAGDS